LQLSGTPSIWLKHKYFGFTSHNLKNSPGQPRPWLSGKGLSIVRTTLDGGVELPEAGRNPYPSCRTEPSKREGGDEIRESFSLSVPFEATSLEDASNWKRCKLSDKRRPWDKSPFKDVDMMRQQKIEKLMQVRLSRNS
jgi:hypothetical protein